MKLSKPEWIRTSALLAALAMVLAGLVLCRLGTPVASSTASEAGAPAVAQAQAPAATPERADEEVPADAAPAVEPVGLAPQPGPTEQSTADVPAPAPRKPAPPAPKPKAVTRKPVAQSYLPPFQPGAYADQTAVTSGPPPNVLWLSGVIQGDPMVAVLRRGESRYYVRQGDTIDDNYTVVGISSSEVTLRRGRTARVLRIGKH